MLILFCIATQVHQITPSSSGYYAASSTRVTRKTLWRRVSRCTMSSDRSWAARPAPCHTAGIPLPQVDALVVPELPIGHVAVVADDLADVLGGHVLLLRVHEPEFPLLRIALGLQLLPLAGCGDNKAAGSAPGPLGRTGVQGPALLTFLLQLLLRHVVGQRRQGVGHRGAAAAVREDGGHGDSPARGEEGLRAGTGPPPACPPPSPRHPHTHPRAPIALRPPSPAAATSRAPPPQWRPSSVASAPPRPGCGRGRAVQSAFRQPRRQ